MGELILVGVIVAVLVVPGLREDVWQERHRLRKKLRRMRAASVAAVPERVAVKIVGVIEPYEDAALTAPLTLRQCVAYQVVVYPNEERSTNDRGAFYEAVVPFRVADESGYAIIEPSRAKLLLALDDESRTGMTSELTRRQRAFLSAHGVDTYKRYRFREGALLFGQRVAIRGYAVREPDPEGMARTDHYRAEAPLRVRLSGSANAPMLISNSGEVLGR